MSNQFDNATAQSNDDAELAALLAALDDEDGQVEDDLTDDLDLIASEFDTDDLDGLDEAELVAADAEDDLDDDLLSEVVGEVELQEAKSEAYADQDAEAAAESLFNKPAAPSTDDGKSKSESKTKSTRMNTSGMKPSEVIKAKLGESVYETFIMNDDDALLDDGELRTVIDDRIAGVDHLPKKIAEKAVNMLLSVSKGATLSTYTRIALNLLAKNTTIAVKDIKAAYITRPYSEGTANAQSSQMMKLFPYMGIAKREGNTLTLNENSALFAALMGEDEEESE